MSQVARANEKDEQIVLLETLLGANICLIDGELFVRSEYQPMAFPAAREYQDSAKTFSLLAGKKGTLLVARPKAWDDPPKRESKTFALEGFFWVPDEMAEPISIKFEKSWEKTSEWLLPRKKGPISVATSDGKRKYLKVSREFVHFLEPTTRGSFKGYRLMLGDEPMDFQVIPFELSGK